MNKHANKIINNEKNSLQMISDNKNSSHQRKQNMQMRNQLKTYSDALSNTSTKCSNDVSEISKEIANNYNIKGNSDESYYHSSSTGSTNERKVRRITSQKILKNSIKIDSTVII